MITKRLTLLAALLLCFVACNDPEAPTPKPQGPTPTPNTVYEPLILEILSASQYYGNHHQVLMENGQYKGLLFILFKTKFEFDFFAENDFYVWVVQSDGSQLAFDEGFYGEGALYAIMKGEEANCVWDIKEPYYGRQYFAFWFPRLGVTTFKLRFYNPQTKIYYETGWFRGTLTEWKESYHAEICYVDIEISKEETI